MPDDLLRRPRQPEPYGRNGILSQGGAHSRLVGRCRQHLAKPRYCAHGPALEQRRQSHRGGRTSDAARTPGRMHPNP